MKHRHSPEVERAVHLELLRARAAIERESLLMHASRLGDSLDPRALIGRVSQIRGASILFQGFDFAKRYPFVTSTLSTLLFGRFSRLAKFGGIALTLWQAIMVAQKQIQDRASQDHASQDR